MSTRGHLRAATVLSTVAVLLSVSGCGMPADRRGAAEMQPPGQAAAGLQGYAVSAPGRLRGDPVTPDLLVVGATGLPEWAVRQVRTRPGVRDALPLSVAQVALPDRTLTLAAADPSRLRRWTSPALAEADEVWARVAGGAVVVDAALEGVGGDGRLPLSRAASVPAASVAAHADLPPQLDGLVNQRWATHLGMPGGNALLVDVSADADLAGVVTDLRARLDGRAGVLVLDPASTATGPQTALLTGGSVADAVGSFTYVPREDGTVEVDDAWVAANIRTEEVPILGTVTCHRVMLPQLRGALTEVVALGLADRIHPDEYAGCYYPRFIGHDPARGLSLHTWGIAVDLNVPGNQRGTAGEIDPDVVAVFKRWGFAWGGDWDYTDPMHFELAALVEAR